MGTEYLDGVIQRMSIGQLSKRAVSLQRMLIHLREGLAERLGAKYRTVTLHIDILNHVPGTVVCLLHLTYGLVLLTHGLADMQVNVDRPQCGI